MERKEKLKPMFIQIIIIETMFKTRENVRCQFLLFVLMGCMEDQHSISHMVEKDTSEGVNYDEEKESYEMYKKNDNLLMV